MARLRNRIAKADLRTDPELLRWHRDKRATYEGIWQMAEDSACLEDDPFGWKLLLWPSPLDADITVEMLTAWRDEFVAADKLICYRADGKDYLYIRTFHQHEHPRNPQTPDLPLPGWVKYVTIEVPRKDGGTNKIHRYEVDESKVPLRCKALESLKLRTDSVPTPNGLATDSPVQSSPVRSGPELILSEGVPPSGDAPVDNSSEEPDDFRAIDFEEEPSGEASKDNRTPAQKAVAFYVDEHKRVCGSEPTETQVGIAAGLIGKKMSKGSKPENVEAALRKLIRNGKPLKDLPSLIDEAEAAAARQPGPGPPLPTMTPEEKRKSWEVFAATEEGRAVTEYGRGIGRPL